MNGAGMKIFKKFKLLWHAKIFIHFSNVIENTDLAFIFLLHLGKVFTPIAGFITFPIILATNVVTSVLTIYQENNKKNHSTFDLSKVYITLATSLGIITAILLSFVGTGTIAAIAPMILTGVLGVKSLFELGAACYCWCKYVKHKNKHPHKSEKYYQEAKELMITFCCSAFGTAAIGGVLIAGKEAVGILFVTSGIFAASYSGYKIYEMLKEKKKQGELKEATQNLENNQSLSSTNNAKLHANMHFVIKNNDAAFKYFKSNTAFSSIDLYKVKQRLFGLKSHIEVKLSKTNTIKQALKHRVTTGKFL